MEDDKYFFQDESGQWFHYDETWSEGTGPFITREEAEISLEKYVKYLKHGENMIFNQIWNMQHELNKVIGKDTVFAENKLEWLFMYCEALNDEVIELMSCYELVFIKHTEYCVNELNYKNAKIESVDCLHFLMSIFQILNFKSFNYFENEYIKFDNNTCDIIEKYYYFAKEHNSQENNHLVIYRHIINLLNRTNNIKNRTNWKWWSKSVKAIPDSQFKLLINKDDIEKETSMALLELMYIFYYLNMTPENILDIYEKKCKINHERQKNDYDIKTKNENDNLELEKQI